MTVSAASLHTEPRQPFPRFRHVGQQLRIRSPPGRHHEAIALGRLPRVPERSAIRPSSSVASTNIGGRRRSTASAPARAGAPIVTASRQQPRQRQVQVKAVARCTSRPGRACRESRSASGSPPQNRPAPDRGRRRSSPRAAEPAGPVRGWRVPVPCEPPWRRSAPARPCRRARATRAAPSGDGE